MPEQYLRPQPDLQIFLDFFLCLDISKNWLVALKLRKKAPLILYYALIKKNFLIYKEIQSGAVAKSYMTNGLLIYGDWGNSTHFLYFLIY